MTIVGETYQINGTENNAYCRSHRPIAVSECFDSICGDQECEEDDNYLNFKSYSSSSLGLRMFMPGSGSYLPEVFICENV